MAISPDLAPTASLRDMVGIVADELMDLEVVVHDLQDLIGTLAAAIGPSLPREAIVRLQYVDSVSQRLTHLVQLLRVLQRDAAVNASPIPGNHELFDALVRLRGARGQPTSW